jgi:hypothetical protein
MDLSNIIKYAHVSEIIDRISIEELKVAEFRMKVAGGETGGMVDDLLKKIKASEGTAGFQRSVLRDRIKAIPDIKDPHTITNLILGTIAISVGAAIVSRFENAKREAHETMKPFENDCEKEITITSFDHSSRDACEMRAQGKIKTNKAIKKLFSKYDYPQEPRTFKEEI